MNESEREDMIADNERILNKWADHARCYCAIQCLMQIHFSQSEPATSMGLKELINNLHNLAADILKA